MSNQDWSIHRGASPILATAIHNGNSVREELKKIMLLGDADRLREEDPFTGKWTVLSDNSIVMSTSRFEVDMNRPRENAMYRRPEDAWGLKIWTSEPTEEMVGRSLDKYDAFYGLLREWLEELRSKHGRFVVYDIHSYNHRRNGPDAPPEDESANPELNLGTGSMDKNRWGDVADAFMKTISEFDYRGRKLDIRENIKFKGGWMSQWIHREFPDSGCCLAIELKKFFMDEWTGEQFPADIETIGKALTSTVQPVLQALEHVAV